MNFDKVTARVIKRNLRRGKNLTKTEVTKIVKDKGKRREKIKGASLGIAGLATSIIPFGSVGGSLIDHLVPDNILEKIPQVNEFVKEASEAVNFDKALGFSLTQIVMRDVIPTLRAFENGDYKEGIAGLVVLAGVVTPIILKFI